MPVVCLRRRRLLLLAGVALFLTVSIFIFPGAVHVTFDLRSNKGGIEGDYDAVYDSMDNPYRPAGGWDRKPQQASDSGPSAAGVGFGDGEHGAVKRYAFLRERRHWNPEEPLSVKDHLGPHNNLDPGVRVQEQDREDTMYDADDYEYGHGDDDSGLTEALPNNAGQNRNQLRDYRESSTRATQLRKPQKRTAINYHDRVKVNRSSAVVRGVHEINAPATQLQMPEHISKPKEVYHDQEKFQIIQGYIYWADDVIRSVPIGLSHDASESFHRSIRESPVTELLPPSWTRCGRPKNQYVLLQDRTAMCARYRHPHDRLIQGEVLSYYLSRMLNMHNVPVITLSRLNTSTPQWKNVNITQAGWEEGKIVALIQWIYGLESERSRVKMPALLVNAYKSGSMLDGRVQALSLMSRDEIIQLIQWTDMVVFDYITGHYDRVASMQDGADHEQNPSILTESIRNLRQDWHNGVLWLIDNESGLFDAYDLLYHSKDSARFQQFHRQMLRTICVFSSRTIKAIEKLLSSPGQSTEDHLLWYISKNEPLFDEIPRGPEFQRFREHFRERLQDVLSWVHECLENRHNAYSDR